MKTKLKFSLTSQILKYSLIFAIVMVCTPFAKAQVTIEDRLAKLEAQIAQQNTTISNLQSEVQSVTKQNLALKNNLNLKPTISKCKIGENIEYRVLEVIGNKETGDIHVTMTVNNSGVNPVELYLFTPEIVDELGAGYSDKDRSKMVIKGVSDDIYFSNIKQHPNAPYNIDMVIKKYNQEAQYIKHFSGKLKIEGIYDYQYITFENLPIRWVESID